MKIFKWWLGIMLIIVPVSITVYVVIVALWKILLMAILFLAMMSFGAYLVRESR